MWGHTNEKPTLVEFDLDLWLDEKIDCTGFHTAFASTLGYHSCFEEYEKADFAVFAGANVEASTEANAAAIVNCYEEFFEDSGAISRPRAIQL